MFPFDVTTMFSVSYYSRVSFLCVAFGCFPAMPRKPPFRMHDYLHYMLFNSQFGVAYHFVAEEGFMQFVHNVEANYKATGDLKQPCNRKSVAGQLLEDENKTQVFAFELFFFAGILHQFKFKEVFEILGGN